MSSLLARSLRPSRAVVVARTPLKSATSSSFHTTSIRSAMSESDRGKDTPEQASKIESHKQDSVNKAKSGSGEWKPELASNSEQSVAAEKDNKSMKEMQDEGAKKAEQGKKP